MLAISCHALSRLVLRSRKEAGSDAVHMKPPGALHCSVAAVRLRAPRNGNQSRSRIGHRYADRRVALIPLVFFFDTADEAF